MTELAISASNLKLQAEGLGLRFPDASVQLFEGISFCLKSGEILLITGPNSSGKSSLIKCLCGIIPKSIKADTEGRISVQGIALEDIPLCEIFRYMSVVLADAPDQILMPSVELELAFALENMGLDATEIRSRLEQAAARFGLAGLLSAPPQKLSGGEQRKLLLAISHSMQNPIMIFDEPETGLSGSAMDTLCEWLAELRASGRGIIIASHNPRLIDLADHVIRLEGKRV